MSLDSCYSRESNYDEQSIDSDVSDENWVRCDYDFHKFVQIFTESSIFNGFIMTTIMLNAMFMAFETDIDIKANATLLFIIADDIFLGIYTVEFILKIYAEPVRYFYSSYNIFDFIVLIISYFPAIFSGAGGGDSGVDFIRVLRALRALRTLRTVSFIRGLQVLVTALLDTIRKSVLNVVLLLLLLMFLFGIVGYYFFGSSDKEHWGGLGPAMLTLFAYVTVDGWTDLQQSLDDKGLTGSRFYTISFIFLGHFIFTNIFISAIIMNIHDATEDDREEQIRERVMIVHKKKEYMIKKQHDDVKQMLEKQQGSRFSNFHEMMEEFQRTLRHDDYVIMVDLATNLTWLETFITSLDHQDNTIYRLQQLNFEVSKLLAMDFELKLRERYGTS
ncbi:cation channel sperm-associated protein 3-like [Saccoglossus kowalevskii]|uniref:Cation channel sperm-associated protein 3-like n=1 Tax=Saccoglossus kowalevskii TaxID=10224 RepID=A0ABM0GIQ9_SACKO|nr:PREDICTED: cation channel sperm-associated protein 3-like [Saccoglossus kowalevskii]